MNLLEDLAREDVVEYFISKSKEEIEKELGVEVARMIGSKIDDVDLWEHALKTVHEINKDNTIEDWRKDDLRLAAFFYNIGRTEVLEFNSKVDEQVSSEHYAKKSVEIMEKILSAKQIEHWDSNWYIEHWDDFNEFINQKRKISLETMAEKILELTCEFESQDYNNDQIRYICSMIVNPKETMVKRKNSKGFNIRVDLDKIDENYKFDNTYFSEYYRPILSLCKAYIKAQNEIGDMGDKKVGYNEEKLENIKKIEDIIKESEDIAQERGLLAPYMIKELVKQQENADIDFENVEKNAILNCLEKYASADMKMAIKKYGNDSNFILEALKKEIEDISNEYYENEERCMFGGMSRAELMHDINMHKCVLDCASNEVKSTPQFLKKVEEALRGTNYDYTFLYEKELEDLRGNLKKQQSIIKGYQGIFLDDETQAMLVELQRDGLDNVVNDMHVTLNFGELEKYPQELMEKEIIIKLVGYASDGKNSGFQVELPEEIVPYNQNNNSTSFITVSLGKVNGVNGKPIDTGKLDFKKLEEPIPIKGKLGYFKFEQDKSKSKVIMNNSIFDNSRTNKEKMQESDEANGILGKAEVEVKWQQNCLSKINEQNNVILSSPTGSGKTKVFLEWAENKGKRPIYITAPIKALSNQRYRELKEKGFVVGLETGDIKSIPENCDYICCTQEIYTNKYIEDEDATLIIDEFHYISDNQNRARTYIDALNKSKAKNILICSATLGDLNSLKEYVDRVSDRDFFTYENKERLTELEYRNEIDCGDIENALVVTFSRRNCLKICDHLMYEREMYGDNQNENEEEILERAKKYKIDKDSHLIDMSKQGIAYYVGSMLPKEKLFVEELFENNLIDTVVGTDALAMGVNFPVQNVVFTQLAKYYDGPISKNLFEQLAGRAGRKGYFDKGNVFFCDDFGVESYEYELEELYQEMFERENENMEIYLPFNISAILKGKTTVEDEVEFITKCSTEQEYYQDYREDLKASIEYELNYIKNYLTPQEGYEEEEGRSIEELCRLKEEFDKNIARTYFDEYDSYKNCALLESILAGDSLEKIVGEYTANFNDMLQLRKYLKRLPPQYRKQLHVGRIDHMIAEIDETVFNLPRTEVEVEEIKAATSMQQGDTKGKQETIATIKRRPK